jgi:hypothetical protein
MPGNLHSLLPPLAIVFLSAVSKRFILLLIHSNLIDLIRYLLQHWLIFFIWQEGCTMEDCILLRCDIFHVCHTMYYYLLIENYIVSF